MVPPEPATSSPEPVVVHTSLRGLGGAVVTPLVLVGVGIAVVTVAGPQPVPLGLVVVGIALALVTLLDYPRHAVFDGNGVTRVCVARRHHLPWSRLVAIERTRPTTTSSVRNAVDKDSQPQVSGGLVARGPGRKRWLLTDRIESNLEYDRLQMLLAALDVPTQLRAARPHDGITPTDLYRRRRH